jgi:vesicle coat complex subunit
VNNLYYRYVVYYDKQKKHFFNYSKSKIVIKFKKYNIENRIEDIEDISFIDKSALERLEKYIEFNFSDFCIELKKILKGINTGRSFRKINGSPSQFGTLYQTRQ